MLILEMYSYQSNVINKYFGVKLFANFEVKYGCYMKVDNYFNNKQDEKIL